MNPIKKSALLLLAITLSPIAQSAAPSWIPKAGAQLSFISQASGKPSGTLVFDFSQAGDHIIEKRVEHLELSRLLLKAVMDQTVESTWHGQTLDGYKSNTIVKSSLKDTNDSLKVTRAANGKLLATEAEGSHELAADAWPLTLTSRDFPTHAPLFDLTHAKIITVSSVTKGFEPVTADGVTQNCERIEIKATAEGKNTEATLWYDTLGRLCAMKFPTALGTVEYIRTSAK